MVINMSKGQKVSMVKDDGSQIKTLFIGVSWDQNRYSGEAEADLDLNGFLTKSDRHVSYPKDIVNYNTYNKSDYPWIWYSGDNRTGNDDEGGCEFNNKHYDEAFIIYADKFPQDRTDFTLGLSIFRAVQRKQNFGLVDNAFIDIFDYDNPSGKSWHYDFSENENFENLNAVEVGRIFKSNGGFRFQALGMGYIGGMTELFKNFGLEIDEGTD